MIKTMRFISILLGACNALAQTDPQASPEVRPDGMITFRILAPAANEVAVRGEWMPGQTRAAMTRDDKGMWSVTLGPLKPQVYFYTIMVDGVATIDMRNRHIKNGVRPNGSLVEVPANPPSPWAMRAVKHGAVHAHVYDSKTGGSQRRLLVYTPPGYDPRAKTRYPVLYLLHGSGDTESEWVETASANLILDNLIADGKAKPMIVVMPNGHIAPAVPRTASVEERMRNTTMFTNDLVTDIVPLVDGAYATVRARTGRAVAGLSMGGGQSLYAGLHHLDLFSSVLVYSSGANKETFDRVYAPVLSNAPDVNKKLKLFWIGCGENDTGALPAAESLVEELKQRGVTHEFFKSGGGHQWLNWREYLALTAPRLFR